MGRAIWSGSVGFGLVQIPVAVHAAEDKDELDMTLLDKRDFSPVGYERVNKKTGKTVAWENVVKGYEHAKGKFVVLTDADFKAANVEATRQIDILDFVEFASIDPRYIDRPYYLAPVKTGKKAYAVLRETLKRTGKAGIGKVVLRTRQHLCAVVAHEKALLLVLLRFADELRKESDLDLPETNLKKLGVTPQELSMAEKLVEGLSGDFKPEKYEDDYRHDLMQLIRKKVKAGKVNDISDDEDTAKPAPEPKGAKVIDLAALLRESVEGKKKRSPGAKAKKSHAAAKSKSGRTKKSAHHESAHRKSA
jgi:DNA end-binding protein Ku